jgi:hypothetical protein
MRYLTTEYVTQEILDTISLMQLNNEKVPILDNIQIDDLATRFLFEWNEVGDYEANLERSLLEYLREDFTTNRINYQFNG